MSRRFNAMLYFCCMEMKRQLKIARLIQRDLSEILQYELPHIRAGAMVTVTKVNVSPDLRLARVYLSVFGVKDKESVVAGMNPYVREVRGLLGNRVRHQLRAIPDLVFILDDSLDYIDRIDELLNDG